MAAAKCGSTAGGRGGWAAEGVQLVVDERDRAPQPFAVPEPDPAVGQLRAQRVERGLPADRGGRVAARRTRSLIGYLGQLIMRFHQP
jgi:hypothetical protein